MSQYYNPKRCGNIFNPRSGRPFKLSRSKIDLFLECPRCFYLDRRLGIGRPPGFPFSLNSAVDKLLKKEFDIHRMKQTPHPLMEAHGIKAVPFEHKMMDEWRNNFKGVRYLHEPTNLLIFGAVDDVWTNPQGELMIVDYKATSKNGKVNLDAEWQIAYKRQMEIYQWLMRRNGFKVSDTGYFVYCNGNADKEAFGGKLEFDIKVIPYKGNDEWIDGVVNDIHKCLMGGAIPEAAPDCDFCRYKKASKEVESD